MMNFIRVLFVALTSMGGATQIDSVVRETPRYDHGPLSLQDVRYDIWFRQYSNTHMPTVRWTLLKAQCYQESRLDPRAVSPARAMGLCQFLEGTWSDYERRLNTSGDIFDPQLNIRFAARYMADLRRQWSSPRPEWDRHSLALASYNAGLGNLLRAQTACGGVLLYEEITRCLPQITGRHSAETLDYVPKIWRWERMIRVAG